MFLHGTDSSLFSTHLIFNMLALYFFSAFVIALVGETAFLLTYFAGGVVGGLMYILFSYIPMPLIQAHYSVVGASGAIYALGGLLMIMRPNARVLMFFIIPMPLWVAILIGFLIITPGVAWQAHLGGLVYGVLVGWYYRRREIRRF
jgi:membrane associated rhomboid family serine protease